MVNCLSASTKKILLPRKVNYFYAYIKMNCKPCCKDDIGRLCHGVPPAIVYSNKNPNLALQYKAAPFVPPGVYPPRLGPPAAVLYQPLTMPPKDLGYGFRGGRCG